MKDWFALRRIEERLRGASPAQSGSLTKKLVRLKERLMQEKRER